MGSHADKSIFSNSALRYLKEIYVIKKLLVLTKVLKLQRPIVGIFRIRKKIKLSE